MEGGKFFRPAFNIALDDILCISGLFCFLSADFCFPPSKEEIPEGSQLPSEHQLRPEMFQNGQTNWFVFQACIVIYWNIKLKEGCQKNPVKGGTLPLILVVSIFNVRCFSHTFTLFLKLCFYKAHRRLCTCVTSSAGSSMSQLAEGKPTSLKVHHCMLSNLFKPTNRRGPCTLCPHSSGTEQVTHIWQR